MRLFGLRTCDTCRKALAMLRAAGHAPAVIDVRADGIAPADLAAILAAFGDRSINRASTTWRALSEAEKSLPPDALLRAHPAAMKRPVIDAGGTWHIGWDRTTQTALLG